MEAGKANSRAQGAFLAASITATMRASVSGAMGRDLTRGMSAAVAEGPVVGTSIMGCDKKILEERRANET